MIIICDIDGTIANCSHRVPLVPDWDAFHEKCIEDKPIKPVVNWLVRTLDGLSGPEVPVGLFFLTGRPEKYRTVTTEWLRLKCGIVEHDDYGLIMRPNDDFTPDHELKPELFALACAPGGLIHEWGKIFNKTVDDQYIKDAAVFLEDRDRVVAAWRSLGYCCLQPQEGQF